MTVSLCILFQCYYYFTTAPPKINLKSFFVDLIERKNMKKSLEFLNYGQNIFDYMYNRHYATLLVSSFRNYQPFSPLSCEFHFFNLFFSSAMCTYWMPTRSENTQSNFDLLHLNFLFFAALLLARQRQQ